MKTGAPWSVKGIDPQSREAAKMAARRAGMTLGEWFNQVIADQDGKEHLSPADLVRDPEAWSDKPSNAPGWEKPLGDISNRLGRAESKSNLVLKQIDTAISGISNRLIALDNLPKDTKDMSDLMRRFDALEARTKDSLSKTGLRVIEKAVSDVSIVLQTSEDRHARDLKSVEGNVQALTNQLNAAEVRLGEVLDTVDLAQITESDGTVNEMLQSVSYDLSAMSARLEDSERKSSEYFSTLQRNVAHLSQRLDHVEGEVASSDNTQVQEIETYLDTFQSQIDAHEERSAQSLGGLDNEFKEMRLTLEAQAQQARATIQAVNQGLEMLTGRIEKLETNDRDYGRRRTFLHDQEADISDVFDRNGFEAALHDTHLPETKTDEDASAEKPAATKEPVTEPDFMRQTFDPIVGAPDTEPLDEPNKTDTSEISETDGISDLRSALLAQSGTDEDGDLHSSLRILNNMNDNDPMTRRLFYGAATIAAACIGLTLAVSVPSTDQPDYLSPINRPGLFGDRPAQVAETTPPAKGDATMTLTGTLGGTVEPAAIDITKAAFEAARSGDPKAQFALGRAYALGNGVDQDDQEALRWYEQAANSNLAIAQFMLGTKLQENETGADNLAKALVYFRSAAQLGNVKAMHALASAYAHGTGTRQNLGEAFAWYDDAARYGLVDAQYNLGVFHERGYGTPKDLAQAYHWYFIAASTGDAAASTAAIRLEDQLTQEQLTAIVATAETWRADVQEAVANGRFDLSLDAYGNADHRAQVALTQNLLTKHGYLISATDGILDQSTEEAVRAYQRLLQIPATGQISPNLIARLEKTSP